MRMLAFIMALLTLQLSTGSCCEPDDTCGDLAHTETRQPELPSDDCPGSEGPCSPFYSCGTCPGCIKAGAIQFEVLKISLPKVQLYAYYPEIIPAPNSFRLLRPPIREFS